ncbi:hypothetical protein ANCDUO_22306, partial [Ancylostoma duodenale]
MTKIRLRPQLRTQVKQRNFLQYVNTISSDALNGFPCWCDEAATVYMNQPEVRKALHIPDSVGTWLTFNPTLNTFYYNRSYFELDGELKFILSNYIYK